MTGYVASLPSPDLVGKSCVDSSHESCCCFLASVSLDNFGANSLILGKKDEGFGTPAGIAGRGVAFSCSLIVMFQVPGGSKWVSLPSG